MDLFPGRLRRVLRRLQKGGLRLLGNVLCANRYLPENVWFFLDVELLQLDHFNRSALKPLPPGYARRVLDPRELGDLAEAARCSGHKEIGEIEHEFAALLAQGQRCFVVTCESRIVAYAWTFTDRYRLDGGASGFLIELEPNMVCFAVAFVQPEHRRLGLFSQLVDLAVEFHGRHNRFFSGVYLVNDASLDAHRRIGFRPVATFTCCRLLGLPFQWSFRRGTLRGQIPEAGLRLAALLN